MRENIPFLVNYLSVHLSGDWLLVGMSKLMPSFTRDGQVDLDIRELQLKGDVGKLDR